MWKKIKTVARSGHRPKRKSRGDFKWFIALWPSVHKYTKGRREQLEGEGFFYGGGGGGGGGGGWAILNGTQLSLK